MLVAIYYIMPRQSKKFSMDAIALQFILKMFVQDPVKSFGKDMKDGTCLKGRVSFKCFKHIVGFR